MTENNNTWVNEFRKKLDEYGEKHKKYCEKIDELRKKSKQLNAKLIRHLKEKYGGDME